MSSKDRIDRLKKELNDLAGGNMKAWTSDKMPAELEERFLRNVLAFETAPTTTNFQQLLDKGIQLPEPDSILDGEIRTKLWEVLVGLADLSVFLEHTDHLSDRELYTKLWNDVLRTEVVAVDDVGFNQRVNLLASFDEPEASLYLRYFADDEWRRHWVEDNPGYILPPQEDPPFNRDYLLPVSSDVQPPEALTWLRANWNRSALAGNRFGPTAEAITFVEQLYAAGATEVAIDNVMMLPNHEWTPYADTLIVTLPEDPARRRELFELMRDVGQPDEDGGEPVEELLMDHGQESVRLWWD